MDEILTAELQSHKEESYLILRHYQSLNKPFLLRSELWDLYCDYCCHGANIIQFVWLLVLRWYIYALPCHYLLLVILWSIL